MELDEYRRMFEAETRHWWYGGLHALVRQMRRRYAKAAAPWLDVGCGTGGLLAQAGPDAYGVDGSAAALTFCRQRGLCKTALASAGRLPFDAKSFGFVTLMDVLYHREVGEPGVVLGEAWRVLRPGGCVLVNVPAYEALRSSHDRAIHTARRFRRSQVTALLRSVGFEVLKTTYWNTILFPAAAGLRLLRQGREEGPSDVTMPGSIENTLGRGALTLERAWLTRLSLPFGLSVFAAGRKPPEVRHD
jgi:SAM-dependent methyltransferase